MTVLKISQDTLIMLPAGATGGAVKISYNGTTTGPVIASGDDQGRAVITAGRLAKLTAMDGQAPLQIVGREAGGRRPASVTLRIYPNYPMGTDGPPEPITLTGLPVGSPDAPGIWDMSNIDDSSGGMDVVTPAEKLAWGALKTQVQTAGAYAQVQGDRADAALADIAQRQDVNDQAQASNNSIVQQVGSVQDVTTYQALNSPGIGAFAYESGTFRRWGSVLGVLQGIDRMTYKIKQWDATKPIPRLAFRLRDGGEAGAVLYEQIQAVNLTTGVATDVVFNLPNTFINAENKTLWHEIDALDGGVMGLYDTGVGTVKYSSLSGYPGWLTLSGAHGLWVKAEQKITTPTLQLSEQMKARIAESPALQTLADFNAALGGMRPVVKDAQISGPYSSNDNNTSTFTSWSSPVGIRNPFNYTEFRVNPWSSLPTTPQVRVRIHENGAAGTLLGDVTLTLSSLVLGGGPQTVRVYWDQMISSTQPLFFRFFANFKTGRDAITLTYPAPAYPMAMYGTNGSLTDFTQNNVSAQINLYVRFGVWDTEREIIPSPSLSSKIDPHWGAKFIIPSSFYAVQGREFNVYYDNVISSYFPVSHFWVDVANTVPADPTGLDVTRKGRQQAERFTLTPHSATVGTHSITFDLAYGGQKISTRTASLKIAAPTTGAGITRKWVAAGDSTTNASVYPAEVVTLFNADTAPMRMTLLGTNSGTMNGYQNTKTEGYSGKTALWLYRDPASPFTFSADGTDPAGPVFNFARYLAANGFAMAADDWFSLHIGINDVFQLGDDDGVRQRVQEMIADINAMFVNAQAAVPGLRCALLETIPPSSNQDAFGESYGVNYDLKRYRRNRDLLVEGLQAAFEGRTANKIWYAPLGCALDTVNNMARGGLAPANSRSTVQIQRQANGVHPDIPGYQQMADAIYAFFKCQEA